MWKSPSSVSRNYGKEFSIWWSSIWSQPSNSSCKPKQTTSRKNILSTIRCKNNESLPQSGNDKTENTQKHTCEAKLDGLQSRNMLSNNSCQHEKNQKHSPRAINWEKTNQNKGRWCRCGSIKHLRITSNDCPVGISYKKTKRSALGMGLSLSKIHKAAEYVSA